ncbi:hypothetical protein AB1Y20_015426 [Prymnesium parvum]|uniref:Uncharacterized protein n=1 Tax=Prymnesium parvum TaxID=97485 RepID=A0AB34JYC4_PRYPA
MLAARAGSVGLRENVRHMCTQNSDVSFKATLAEFAQTAEETLKIPGFPEQLKPVLESMIAKKAAWDKNDELNPEYVAAVEAFMAKMELPEESELDEGELAEGELAEGELAEGELDEEEDESPATDLIEVAHLTDMVLDQLKANGLGTYTLSAADKKELLEEMKAAAVAKGIDPSLVGKSIPDTIDLL